MLLWEPAVSHVHVLSPWWNTWSIPTSRCSSKKKKVLHRWSACLFSDHRTLMRGRQKQRGDGELQENFYTKALVAFALKKKKKKEYYKKCDFGIRGFLFNLASTLPAPILDVRCALTVHAPLFIQRAPSTRGSNEIKAGDVAVRGRWECYRCSDLLWPAAAHLSGTIVRDPGISQWRASLIHPAKVHLLWLNILKQPNGCAC